MATPRRQVRSARAAVSAKKDYAAIAAKYIQRPSEQKAKLPDILIYSRNKKGKTRFCISAGQSQVLIVDPERGTDRFLRLDPDVWHISRWEDLDDIYNFFRIENPRREKPYRYVALDGMSRISNMALKYVMAVQEQHDLNRKPGMVQQRDYGRAGELVKTLLFNFRNLDVGVIYTCHERQEAAGGFNEDEEVEDAEVQYVADLPKGVRAQLNGIVDVIGRLYVVKVDKGDKKVIQRRLWLEPSAIYDTGARSDQELPQYLANPTVPKLIKLLKEGTPNG